MRFQALRLRVTVRALQTNLTLVITRVRPEILFVLGMSVVVKIMIPFWGTLNIRCCIIVGIQKRTTHAGNSFEQWEADDHGHLIAEM